MRARACVCVRVWLAGSVRNNPWLPLRSAQPLRPPPPLALVNWQYPAGTVSDATSGRSPTTIFWIRAIDALSALDTAVDRTGPTLSVRIVYWFA